MFYEFSKFSHIFPDLKGPDLLEKCGGLHNYMGWSKNLLTDSGGFQMVSLLELAEITEVVVNERYRYYIELSIRILCTTRKESNLSLPMTAANAY